MTTINGPFAPFVRNADDFETYADGATVFQAGDTGDCLFAVRSGTVELRSGGAVLQVIEPGGVFGEMVLVGRTVRSATAVCRGETTLVRVDQGRFDRAVQVNPFLAREFMKLMADRLAATNERLGAAT